jgi:hypothetical protein
MLNKTKNKTKNKTIPQWANLIVSIFNKTLKEIIFFF